MVFQADMAFALELIALGIGFWILIKARGDEAGNLKGFGTFIGYFIIIAAFIALLCTGYYSVKYWEDGHFNNPAPGKMMMMQGMHKMQGCNPDMMSGKAMHSGQCGNMMDKGPQNAKCEKMMKDGGMMKGDMKGMMGDKSGNGDHMNSRPEKNK